MGKIYAIVSVVLKSPVSYGLFLLAWIVFWDTELRDSWQLNWAGGLEKTPPWQFISCHFTHWSMDQLFWDSIAFLVLGVICEQRNRVQFAATMALSAVAVSITVVTFEPAVTCYRGLSGMDSALFVLAAIGIIHDAWESNRNLAILGGFGLIAFLAKTAFEFHFGSTLFVTDESFRPLPVAHLVGALAAVSVLLFAFLATELTKPFRKTRPNGFAIRCNQQNPNVSC